jgi:hypothetical protein
MSHYYDLWRNSEAARNAIITVIMACLSAQIGGYYLIPRLIPQSWIKLALWIYPLLVIVTDLAGGIYVGVQVR